MRAAIYLRVSTDEQTTENQRRELLAVAERKGWQIVGEHADHGISGSKGREARPALDALLRAVTRREVDVVMAWSVDRLGRSLRHLVLLLDELKAQGVGLYLHQQGIDTTTPMGEAFFGMAAVFAQFERSILVERTKAGLARARAQGKRLGRPPIARARERQILQLRSEGKSIHAIRRALGLGTKTVQRVLAAAG